MTEIETRHVKPPRRRLGRNSLVRSAGNGVPSPVPRDVSQQVDVPHAAPVAAPTPPPVAPRPPAPNWLPASEAWTRDAEAPATASAPTSPRVPRPPVSSAAAAPVRAVPPVPPVPPNAVLSASPVTEFAPPAEAWSATHGRAPVSPTAYASPSRPVPPVPPPVLLPSPHLAAAAPIGIEDAGGQRGGSGEPPAAGTTNGKAYRWSFLSLGVRVILQALSGVVIARQIGPHNFGSGMLIVSIYGVASSAVQMGANGTLVIRRIIPRSMLRGIIAIDAAFGIIAATAIGIAGFLEHGDMRIGLWIAAAGCLIQAASGPGLALSTRALQFGRISIGEMSGALLGTSVALVISSMTGSLIALPLQMVLVDTSIAVIVVRSLFTKPAELGELASTDIGYRYGLQSAGNQAASTGARNADNYLVASFLGQSALGMYVLAYRLMMLPIQNIAMVLTRVLVPRLRHLVSEAGSVASEVRRVLLAIALPIGAMTGAALPFVRHLMTVIFGARYAGAIGPTETLLIATFPQCCSNVASCVFAATGHGRTQLKLTAVGLAFAVLAVVIGFHWGIQGVTISYAVLSFVLAALSVNGLRRLDLAPVRPFVEALRFFTTLGVVGGGISLAIRIVTPRPALSLGIVEIVVSGLAAALVVIKLQPMAASASLGFWRSVIRGQA